jgi:hypothetical protein
VARTLPAAGSPPAAVTGDPLRRHTSAVILVLACYLVAAVAVTARLWADPASRTVAGNPNDADLFAWFMRYAATAVTHGRLPALVSSAMNAPQGISLMWNTSMLLPAILLTPVTLLAGPQVALTVLMTAGFAGSAASLFAVLRRWDVSTGAAALGGAVYGFSPALVQASTGHYNLQFAVLPPLIVHLGLRLFLPSRAGQPGARSGPSGWQWGYWGWPPGGTLRDGLLLGLLVTLQLFTGEELLMLAAITGLLLLVVLAASRPREVLGRLVPAAIGLAVAGAAAVVLSGYALWVQFHGPLTQHGSAFTPDFFKNDLSGFVTPSNYLLFHTAASAAAATRFQGGTPEYLAYLGWPLIIVAALCAAAFWRRLAVRAAALSAALLELLSLGSHPLVSGTVHQGVTLPWHWLASLPLVGTVLPDRLSIAADGLLGAVLAFSLDAARARLGTSWAPHASAGALRPDPAGLLSGWSRRWAAALPAVIAVLACLPLIPVPLQPATAAGVPAGWPAAFARLRLAPDARVLVVPVPTATQTDALRWQADTGQPGELIGGYFVGPAWNGQAYVEGNGVRATATYLDQLWSGGPAAPVPAGSQVLSDMNAWRPAAVVAVTSPGSALGRYLQLILGPPSFRSGAILAWRR